MLQSFEAKGERCCCSSLSNHVRLEVLEEVTIHGSLNFCLCTLHFFQLPAKLHQDVHDVKVVARTQRHSVCDKQMNLKHSALFICYFWRSLGFLSTAWQLHFESTQQSPSAASTALHVAMIQDCPHGFKIHLKRFDASSIESCCF